METNGYNNLLRQVNILNSHYKKINQITGENFNVFKILNLQSSEVRLHSAFIAELLNPKGSHGQGHIFLDSFVENFCFKNQEINASTCKIDIEKHTGFIDENYYEGGRIDIVITDKKTDNKIIIENKIYAGDQKNQLLRYYKYSNSADLIYLTLDGKEPSEKSRGDLINGTHFKCLSYKFDIINWLESCRKEVSIYPIIRESITQYINLIKYLTNQTLNDTMQKELTTIIRNNLEACFTISENFDNSLYELFKLEFPSQLQNMCNELDLEFENSINFNKNYSGMFFWKKNWNHVSIGFQFQTSDKNMIYGFAVQSNENGQPVQIPTELRQSLELRADASLRRNDWWPIYFKLESPYDNWRLYETWKAIFDGSMIGFIKDKIENLINITQGLDL